MRKAAAKAIAESEEQAAQHRPRRAPGPLGVREPGVHSEKVRPVPCRRYSRVTPIFPIRTGTMPYWAIESGAVIRTVGSSSHRQGLLTASIQSLCRPHGVATCPYRGREEPRAEDQETSWHRRQYGGRAVNGREPIPVAGLWRALGTHRRLVGHLGRRPHLGGPPRRRLQPSWACWRLLVFGGATAALAFQEQLKQIAVQNTWLDVDHRRASSSSRSCGALIVIRSFQVVRPPGPARRRCGSPPAPWS